MKRNGNLHIDEYFLQETSGWLRELDFFLSELAFLKTRLAHIVDSGNDKDFVAKAEKFQNDFINHDEKIKSIKAEVLSHENRLQKILPEVKKNNKNVSSKQQTGIRKKVASVELEFISLKNSFNSYALNSLSGIA